MQTMNKPAWDASRAYLEHSGVKGMKHGVRQYQYKDGSLTPLGREHYGVGEPRKEGEGKSESGEDRVEREKAIRKQIAYNTGNASEMSKYASEMTTKEIKDFNDRRIAMKSMSDAAAEEKMAQVQQVMDLVKNTATFTNNIYQTANNVKNFVGLFNKPKNNNQQNQGKKEDKKDNSESESKGKPEKEQNKDSKESLSDRVKRLNEMANPSPKKSGEAASTKQQPSAKNDKKAAKNAMKAMANQEKRNTQAVADYWKSVAKSGADFDGDKSTIKSADKKSSDTFSKFFSKAKKSAEIANKTANDVDKATADLIDKNTEKLRKKKR